jgi:GNAT superfamily N-acetyltransferase
MDDEPVLRPARVGDIEAIAVLWYHGWREAHLGHVPDALLAHRTPDTFRARAQVNLRLTTVATVGGVVAGIVVVRDDEVEQMYVDSRFRGSGVATALLAHGESIVAQRYVTAWLAVVDGNARARRFYERCGWHDTRPFDEPAWTPDGTTIPVPTRRYEKRVDPA